MDKEMNINLLYLWVIEKNHSNSGEYEVIIVSLQSESRSDISITTKELLEHLPSSKVSDPANTSAANSPTLNPAVAMQRSIA